MMVMMVMPGGSKYRAGKDHQQKSGCKNLFHGLNRSTVSGRNE